MVGWDGRPQQQQQQQHGLGPGGLLCRCLLARDHLLNAIHVRPRRMVLLPFSSSSSSLLVCALAISISTLLRRCVSYIPSRLQGDKRFQRADVPLSSVRFRKAHLTQEPSSSHLLCSPGCPRRTAHKSLEVWWRFASPAVRCPFPATKTSSR